MSYNFLQILFLLVSFSALSAYLNSKYLKLPAAVGVTIASLVLVGVINYWNKNSSSGFLQNIQLLINSFNFYDFLLNGIIGFLLFASAIKFEIANLKRWWWQISLLSTIGVVISTLCIGGLIYGLGLVLNIHLPLLYCMLFGAIMSPTDPIAAVATFKDMRSQNPNAVPKHIEIKLLGESLFNDGMGIVVFLTVLGLITGGNVGESLSFSKIGLSLVKEIFGAIIFGFICGWICKYFLKQIKNDNFIEVALFTLALCIGSYEGAIMLHFSAPISVVVSGLVVGHKVKQLYSEKQLHHLHLFWEFIDEILNTSLFALIGVTVVFIHFDLKSFVIGIIGFFAVLLGRYLSLVSIFIVPKMKGKILNGSIPILTYGGIRGGISLALALALLTTHGTNKELSNLLIGMTFISVLMSNLIQGMTLKYMISAFYGNNSSKRNCELDTPAHGEVNVDENNTNNLTLLEKLDTKLQLLFNKLNTGCKNNISKSSVPSKDNKTLKTDMNDVKENVNNKFTSIAENINPTLNNYDIDFLENESNKESNSDVSYELTDSELDLDNMTELEKDQL